MSEWKKELFDLLRQTERKAADGGAYGMAERLRKMSEPFGSSIKDDEIADIVAKAAGVERKDDDLCIVHVPPHWLEGLQQAALTPRKV